jgi:hypothetical protein
MNDIEQTIIANGAATAPRVTPQDIGDEIASEHYFTAMDGVAGRAGSPAIVAGTPTRSPLDLLTFCVLVLKNGYTVTGESACVSPENFNAAIGREIARVDAVRKVWSLLGFRLKDRLSAK